MKNKHLNMFLLVTSYFENIFFKLEPMRDTKFILQSLVPSPNFKRYSRIRKASFGIINWYSNIQSSLRLETKKKNIFSLPTDIVWKLGQHCLSSIDYRSSSVSTQHKKLWQNSFKISKLNCYLFTWKDSD